MEINSMTSMNHEALSSSSETANDPPEESSWTFYMQDFTCGKDGQSSLSSGHESPSLVSDAASSAARKGTDKYETAAFTSERSNCKKLSYKRGKAQGAALSGDLEDTASSPASSPKVSYLNQLNLKQEGRDNTKVSEGNISEHKGLGIDEGNIGYSELKKKGPSSSILANYFD